MIILFYLQTRLKRGIGQALSIVLLTALLCAFFTFFNGFIQQKEREMDSAYGAIPVTVVVSNYVMAAGLFVAIQIGALAASLRATGKDGIRILQEVE